MTYTKEKYGELFVNSNLTENLNLNQKIDQDIDFSCWMKYYENDCKSYSLHPVKERSDYASKLFFRIYLNNFFFNSQHTESFSAIELFFNGMSLCYLYTGVSFNFILRKLNTLVKGPAFRLVYSFGLVWLQIFMIWQIQGIFEIYESNSRMPQIFTITGVELIPPALSVCFFAGKHLAVLNLFIFQFLPTKNDSNVAL